MGLENGPVLGVDCSGELCSVALSVGDAVIEREERRPGEQLTRLVPMILDVLAEAAVERSALARLAVAVGPGSFTGLRLALATVRTMAQVLHLPVVPVPTLDVVAWGMAHWFFEEHPDAARVDAAVLTDARKGQVFTAAYRVERAGLRLHRTDEARAQDPDDAAAWLKKWGHPPIPSDFVGVPISLTPTEEKSRDTHFSVDDLVTVPTFLAGGGGLARYREVFAGYEGMVAPVEAAEPHARHVARAGAGRYGPVEARPYAAVEPMYLRPPDVKPPRS